MSWLDSAWGAVKKAGNYVGNAGADMEDYFFNNPARQQKAGLGQLAQNWRQEGGQQRDWYGAQGAGIDQTFGQTQADIDKLRGNDNAARLKELYNQSAYDRSTAQNDYYTKMTYDPSFRPTEEKDYYDFLNGSKGDLTNQEQLYNERKGGNDPAAQYEDTRAVEAINRQLAARGGYSNTSRAGIGQISDYYANAGAQRSHDLANLAAGADTSRLGKNGALGQAAQGASGETSTYTQALGNAAAGASKETDDYNQYKAKLASEIGDSQEKQATDLINSDQQLANHRAEVMQKITELGGQAASEAQKEAFAAELAALGVDPAKVKDLLSFITGSAKAVAAAV